MMPRLVFVPTFSRVTLTASNIRLPGFTELSAIIGAVRRALSRKWSAVIRWPSAKRCTLPGFSASISAWHAASYAAEICACPNILRQGCCQDFGSSIIQHGGHSLNDGLADVDACHGLQSRPSGHRVDFDQLKRAICCRYDIDTGESGADDPRGTDCQFRQLVSQVRRHDLRLRATLHVRHPIVAATDHHVDRSVGADKYADIPEWRAFTLDIALEIVGIGHFVRRWQIPQASYELHPFALRAKKRLQDHGLRAQLSLNDFARCIQAFHREGGGCRDAGLLQKKRRHRLVDASLDRSSRVPDQNTKIAQRMQDAEPPRYRLEGSTAHGADQNCIRQGAAEAWKEKPALRRAVEPNGFKRRNPSLAPTGMKCSHQRPAAVTRMACDNQNSALGARTGLHAQFQPMLRSSRSKSRSPRRKVSPVSRDVTITRAGLKSNGSMA